jgi:competence protein ComEC
MLLFFLALVFAAGIVVATHTALPLAVWLWWLIVPLGLWFIWRNDARLRRVHLLLLVFVLAALRYTLTLPRFDEHALATYNDRGTMLIVGTVAGYPDVRDHWTNVRFNVTRLRLENVWHQVSGTALLQLPRTTEVRYGDQLQILGEPTTPPDFDTFSYREFLARQDIHSIIRSYGTVKILARDQGDPFFTFIYALRTHALATIHSLFPEPTAALLAGILLGIESGIAREVRDAFNATNTSHIIAISGFNITIIAGMLAALARRVVGPQRATFIVILGLGVYTLLVGAAPSVVRAALMGSLSVLALHYHRQNDALNALGAAALVMLALHPFSLYDVGFQLSFLATLGLILYVQPLGTAFENFLARFTTSTRARQIAGALNDSFIVTLAAQITTTPLIVFAFHRLSLVGLLTNLLILPVQPAVLIGGGLATLAGMMLPPLGQVIAWIVWAFPAFTIAVVQFTAQLPFSSIEIGRWDVAMLVAYYAVLFGLTRLGWQTIRVYLAARPALALGSALVAGVWTWNVALTAPDGKTHLIFLEGGTTLVQSPRGARIVIDGGAAPSTTLAALGQRMPFWERTIDLLVLTDAHEDNVPALLAILERYHVRHIVQVREPTKPTLAYTRWRDLIASRHIAVSEAQRGMQIQIEHDQALEIVWARDEPPAAVVRWRAGHLAFLFASHARVEDQHALLQLGDDLSNSVLLAPRQVIHDFADAVDPRFVLFLRQTAREQPTPDTLAALARATVVFPRPRGKIEITVTGNHLHIR